MNFILTGMVSLSVLLPSAIVCMRLTKSALINGPDNLLLLVFPRRLLSILHSALEQVFFGEIVRLVKDLFRVLIVM